MGVIFFSVLGYIEECTKEKDSVNSDEKDSNLHSRLQIIQHDWKILQKLPKVMLFVIAWGLFLDGLLLPLSYYLDTTIGLIIAISFAVETGVLGFVTSTTLRSSSVSVIGCVLVCVVFTYWGDHWRFSLWNWGAKTAVALFLGIWDLGVLIYDCGYFINRSSERSKTSNMVFQILFLYWIPWNIFPTLILKVNINK